jgi:phosphoenolpyruvate carboxylase
LHISTQPGARGGVEGDAGRPAGGRIDMGKKKSGAGELVELVGESRGGEADLLLDWRRRLRLHRDRIAEDPQFLPVKQLAFEISRVYEHGEVSHPQLQVIVRELCNRALMRRAEMMRERLGSLDEDWLLGRFRKLAEASAHDGRGRLLSFDGFAAKWREPAHGIVFTAHPTFLMSRELRGALVDLIDHGGEKGLAEVEARLAGLRHAPDPDITLAMEHGQAQEAIGYAQEAEARLMRVLLEVARQLYPDDWTRLEPKPVEINSWVGYDLDGRNDIRWFHSIRFRLKEKQLQAEAARGWIEAALKTARSKAVQRALKQLAGLYREELQLLGRQIELFNADLDDPVHLSLAANQLTENKHKGLGPDLSRALPLLQEAIDFAADAEEKFELVLLKARIRARGLGTARMHFRVNAAQLNNAMRGPLKLSGTVDLSSRVLLKKLDRLIAVSPPQQVNFASLALERATAIRQFLVMAQILKHIDGTSPLRMLIAECEHPFTVLAAVYLAKLYGIDDMVDVSPLFETEEALDHGARIISILLKTDGYRDLVLRRGRLCVQTGFSDAGRFLGKIPAALAIERFQHLLAEVVAVDLGGAPIDVLIFDTHGESMGRGAHPASLRDRFEYVLSPWVRSRFAAFGLPLQHEVSFQGGDGYVLFGSRRLALVTLVEMLVTAADADEEPDDQFYRDRDFSLDFFEHIKEYQTQLFAKPDYSYALGAFGTSLLMNTGSRRSKRQFEGSRDKRSAVSELRAIPHNAILQQMGYLVNIVSGVGEAVQHEHDRFIDMYKGSERLRRLIELVRAARRLSSIKTLAAYASLFDDAFWVTRPLTDDEPHVKNACIALADLLRGDVRHDGIMHLATYIREDALRLNDVLVELGIVDVRPAGEWSEGLDLLHAVRIALIQHIYLLAARIPEFSLANDISREQVIGLIVSLRIPEAAALLREVYPVSMPQPTDYDLIEPADDLMHQGVSYASIHKELIDRMEEAYALILEIGIGIAHNFAAHG